MARLSVGALAAHVAEPIAPLIVGPGNESTSNLLREQLEREVRARTGFTGTIVFKEDFDHDTNDALKLPTVEQLVGPLAELSFMKQILPKEDLKGHRPFYEGIVQKRGRKRR